MAIKKTNFYGLNVSKTFTDIPSTKSAVINLGLDEKDLEKINGISEYGGTKTDIQSLSELDQYLSRSITAYAKEVSSYEEILSNSADPSKKLRGNLTVNGIIGGSALKYQYYDGINDEIRIADISTSRTSSWSTTVDQEVIPETTPIQYGLEVEVGGDIVANELEIFKEVRPVIFPDSELPTHKLRVLMDGQNVLWYVMKNLPLIFEGEFRSLNARCELIQPGNVSWRIFYVDNELLSLNFENQGGVNSESILNIADTLTRRKNIEIYHNPDNYSLISLPNCGIKFLPNATIDNLIELDLENNSLNTFPDFSFFAPSLSVLKISKNNFTIGDDSNLRTLNADVIAKIPAGLSELYIGSCFSGPIPDPTVLSGTNLLVMDFSTSSFLKFSGALPVPPPSIQEYVMSGNTFSGIIPSELLSAINLSILNLSASVIENDPIDELPLQSMLLTNVDISGNILAVPDLTNRVLLKVFKQSATMRQFGDRSSILTDSGAWKFTNCSALEELNFENHNVKGYLPTEFLGNTSLKQIKMFGTELEGVSALYTFDQGMFEDCLLTLLEFEYSSVNNGVKPIHPNTFTGLVNLTKLEIEGSYNAFGDKNINGNLPLIGDLVSIERIIFTISQITGTIWPSIDNNPNVELINLSTNSLTGPSPAWTSASLRYFYADQNELTSFSQLNAPNLVRLHLHFNSMTGDIPDLSNMVNLTYLWANNNQLTGYTAGSFTTMAALQRLDLSFNNLVSGAINQIISDLYDNYEANPRTGVTINLAGNDSPDATAAERISFLASNGWSIITS
jgi:hypothetical protein